MDSINNIISDVIKTISERSPQQDLKIQRAWDQVVKDSSFTSIVNFQNNVLTIKVDTSARAYKLKMQMRRILKELQEEVPEIQQIVFRIG